MMPWRRDPVGPSQPVSLVITVDDQRVEGIVGQTIGGVMVASGIDSWRRTGREERPRGIFCGIGVCFDCVVVVNGQRDVRACQRRAKNGDVVVSQRDLPESGDVGKVVGS